MNWRKGSISPFLTYSIILFFIFDGTALGLNIWLTQRIQSQTIELNLAGRQRMLSQKMVKEFLYAPPSATNQTQLTTLKESVSLFDRTLSAFRNGGTTINTDNTLVTIESFQHRPYYPLVEQGWNNWLPLRTQVLSYINTPSPSLYVALNQAFAEQNNLLLNNMNALALAIEQQARYETGKIRFLQAIALLLGMINFVTAYWLYRNRINALEHEKTLIEALLQDMPSAVAVTDDDGLIVQANRKFMTLLAIDSDALNRQKIHDLIVPLDDQSNLYQLSNLAFKHAILKVEKSSAFDNGRHMAIWQIEDVSHDMAEREHLTSLAYKDPLTSLENRVAFEDHLKALNQTSGNDALHAIMFLDLNNFKHVNDNFGHNRGDIILREVGLRLKQFISPGIKIARHGGDEFTILLQNIEDEEHAICCAKEIIEALKTPYYVGLETLHINASIGITSFKGQQEDPSHLITNADRAMYQAKLKPDTPNIHCAPFNG
ncbi:diguanylate cyclase domain-containing protein [Marinomonas gallaica]|uniref:diguanylate cyclase domain-containing protein n=1 Tax=Marinomonas gallaica TaxID=1806667 RepID=UPI003CE4EFF6